MRGKRGARDLGAVSWLADSPLREKVRAVVAGEETSVEAVDSTVAKCQAARKALQLKKDQDAYAVLKQLYYRRSKLRKAQKELREEAQRAREAKRAAIRAEEVAAGARLLGALEKRVRASPEHDLLKKGVALSQLKAMLRARRRAAREAAARQAEIDHAAALLRARLRFKHERVPLDVAALVLDEADCQTYKVTAEVETAHVRCFGSNGKELWDEKGVAAERLSKLASIDALADPETVEKLATALKSIVDEEDSDDDEFCIGLAEFGLDESDIDGFASAVVPRPAKHARRVVACTTPTLQKIESPEVKNTGDGAGAAAVPLRHSVRRRRPPAQKPFACDPPARKTRREPGPGRSANRRADEPAHGKLVERLDDEQRGRRGTTRRAARGDDGDPGRNATDGRYYGALTPAEGTRAARARKLL